MLGPSSSLLPLEVERRAPPPITGAMRKFPDTFPSSWPLFVAIFSLIAVMVAPAAAVARSAKLDRGVKSAQAVTKRGRTTTTRNSDPDRDGLASWTEQRKTRTNPYKFDTD